MQSHGFNHAHEKSSSFVFSPSDVWQQTLRKLDTSRIFDASRAKWLPEVLSAVRSDSVSLHIGLDLHSLSVHEQ